MKRIVLIAASLLLADNLPAAVLVEFDTAGLATGASTVTDSAGHSNIAAGSMTMTSTGNNRTANSFVAIDWTQSTPAAALANGEYISFTITPDSGYQLDLSSLDIVLFYQNGQGDGADWAIYSSADSFASALGSGTDLPGGTYVPASIDLSAPAFNAITGPLEFRVAFGEVNNQWVYAGLSTDNTASWPKPPAVTLDGIAKEGTAGPVQPITITDSAIETVEVYKLITDIEPGIDLSRLYPVCTTNLDYGIWTDIPHADNPHGPYTVTNLTVSHVSNTTHTIYVQQNDGFFGLETRQ